MRDPLVSHWDESQARRAPRRHFHASLPLKQTKKRTHRLMHPGIQSTLRVWRRGTRTCTPKLGMEFFGYFEDPWILKIRRILKISKDPWNLNTKRAFFL